MSTFKHIFISGIAKTEKYKARSSNGSELRIPERDRATHSQKLLRQFDEIRQSKELLEQQRSAEQITTRDGTYLSFKSSISKDLIVKSLESISNGIRLLNIKEIIDNEDQIQIQAIVYIPKGKEGILIKKLNEYETKNNTTIKFQNQQDHNTVEDIINNLGNNIILKKSKDKVYNGTIKTEASISLPVGMESYFITEIQRVFPAIEISISPKNSDLVNSIEDVSIALLEGLWTDKPDLIPNDSSKWCEVWLNVNTKNGQINDQIEQFRSDINNIGIEAKPNNIVFPERAVLLIKANRQQLIELMMQSDLLAEFRLGQEPAGFWLNISPSDQQEWNNDLLQRINIAENTNVKICLLDSGVNNGHILLRPILNDSDALTVNPSWGTFDHINDAGHGTLMAGVAGYGQLEQLLLSNDSILLTHSLCSVKIIPNNNFEPTPIELWGDITAQGILRAEIQNPNKALIYCMSVTSIDGVNRGRPTSWSAEVDNLAFGKGENQRLIVVSAGNIDDYQLWLNYPNSNYVSSIHNPAQSWNALVVGAYTDKIHVVNHDFVSYKPLANKGELSPFSSTSLVWEKTWPIKPDVVFEGGNLLEAPVYGITKHEDLEILSTSKEINQFRTINATSAAAALASWFAAKIAYEYPNAWTETIRGLMIHFAEWTDEMHMQAKGQAGEWATEKEIIKTKLRIFGYGIPNLDRALKSRESALTFIAQESIQPFKYVKENSLSKAETNEIHFYNLPWPKDLLLGLGQTPITLRITISYFTEPGAGEIGWKEKYRYQSHGLRFDLNNVNENEIDFKKRVNIAAREENEEFIGNSGSERWKLGKQNRDKGSVQSDSWTGIASELSTCNHIAVYPVIGWWRERKHLGKANTRTRYSLIISLDTPIEEVELYTTVKNMIEVPIEITTS